MKNFTAKRNYFLLLLVSFFSIAGCGKWLVDATPTVDTASPLIITVPSVTASVPVNNATNVAVNTTVVAIFSEEMDPSTITTTTFTLDDGITPVLGTVAYSGVTAVFTPTNNFADNATYIGTITINAKSLGGNELANEYVWSFTTGVAPDVTAPTVVSIVPLNAANNVAFNQILTATFSEAIDPLTITTTTFKLEHGGR